MSARRTDTLRDRLVEEREALLDVEESATEATNTVELDQTRVGRVSRMDAMQSQAMAKESDRRRRLTLQRIDSALRRMDEGEYGYCVACGEEIAASRLEADPAAPLCIECASRAEQGS